MLFTDSTDWCCVHGIEFWSQHRSLGHAKIHLNRFWQFSVCCDSLIATTKIWWHPLQWFAYYSDIGSRRCDMVLWSIVSNAAERSNITSTVTLFWSRDWRMSFWTFNSAVSVEWNFLYADWCCLCMLFDIKCFSMRVLTTFSRTFDTKGKFDTGL